VRARARGCVCLRHDTNQHKTAEVIKMLTVSQMVKTFCLVLHPKFDHHNHKWALS